ncbi:MAG TPA: CHAP domain-containing protein [Candidatus Saccharimonadales bacterium]|nr:CHAP domain-containing protein [Candidatus Saccharimonadales bacterium]
MGTIPRFSPSKLNKRARRQLIRRSLIAGNVLLLVLVGSFVFYNRSASQTVRASTLNSATATASMSSDPLDQLSSSQIALTAAQMAGLPELPAIKNTADSDSLLLAVVPNDSTALAKPQIVATAEKSKADIITYITQPGDTVSALATKFGVTADSIKWSNNITSDSLGAGVKLFIPPVNGLVYKVKSGDTPASLATRFQADQSDIVIYNDAEINGLTPGELIIIPNGKQPAPVVSYYSYNISSGFAWGSGAIYGENGYDFGECTWYVATQISVPANWGNANTWAAGARASGWTVSPTPTAGAIAQTPYGGGGFGHVGIVVAVQGDQVEIRDMNNYGDGGGWDRVGQGWVPISTYPNYITR